MRESMTRQGRIAVVIAAAIGAIVLTSMAITVPKKKAPVMDEAVELDPLLEYMRDQASMKYAAIKPTMIPPNNTMNSASK